MSAWTHIAGGIYVRGWSQLHVDNDQIRHTLRKALGIRWFPGFDRSPTQKYTPCGSEGGVHWRYCPCSDSEDAAGLVAIWGDLRDYDNIEELSKWVMTPLGPDLEIRAAAVTILPPEPRDVVMFSHDGNGWFSCSPAVMQRERLVRCSACPRWYDPTKPRTGSKRGRWPRADQNHYCPECGRKAKNRFAQRAYRARKLSQP